MALKTYRNTFLLLSFLLVVCFLLNISMGSVRIPLNAILEAISGGKLEKEAWKYIVIQYRLPKAITAILTGSGLAVSGLLMQTLFRNPLAGPFVLGISSGASLGVALLIMGGSIWGIALTGASLLVIAASMGSFTVLLLVMVVASKIRDTMALLIIGLMFGSITGSIVSILSYLSPSEALQRYVFWSLGSLGNISWYQLVVLGVVFLIGMGFSIASLKGLNSLLLGEYYAKSLGLRLTKSKYLIMLATSLLAGSITSFVGPIAFVGLAVPHLTRQVLPTSNHIILLPAVCLYGAILMLLCDTLAQLPFSQYTLPINAVTSIVGAPVVIWLLVRKRKMIF